MNRRNFIKSTCSACAVGIGLSIFLESCTSHKYISNFSIHSNTITLKKNVFTQLKKEKIVEHKFVLLKPENLPFPIAIYKTKAGHFKSFFLKCTHQGCELSAFETAMVCPCHGAEFNLMGEVTQGPAEINLKQFNTTHDTENIYVQIL